MLISTSSGMAAPSLTVEDNMSLDPKTSLRSSLTSDEAFDEKFVAFDTLEVFDTSKAELNPEGVSRSAILLKLGSPRTVKEKMNHSKF